MEEAREKLKILLVRKPRTAEPAEGTASPWDTFVKALKTFTDLEVREYPDALPVSLHELGTGFAHTFLDVELADWRALRPT